MDRKADNITLIQLSNYVKPEVKEHLGRKWVLYGEKNQFLKYIIDRYNGSPTNESIINVYSELLYGKGIVINGQDELYKELFEVFPKREVRKCLKDFKLFGQYAMQILRAKGGGVAKIMHVPFEKIGMEVSDEEGDINNVYFCEDWTNVYKYKPEKYPIFKCKLTEPIMIKVVQPYTAGQFYYANPDYLAGLQYAELEEEISNYSISHIKNGLSFGYIINFNNGAALSDEQKSKIETKIKDKLTGSTNAGKFILSFNDGKDAEVTVVPLEVNDAHSQWEFLSREAMTKLLTAHGVTSPLLFGLTSASGFGSNADELDTASRLLQDYQITPKQDIFLDELASIIELNGLETDLTFLPLRETYKSTETQPQQEVVDEIVDEEEPQEDVEVEMSKHEDFSFTNELIALGEEIDSNEWELIDDRRCDEITLNENNLNTVFQFATTPIGDSRKASEQDTSLFKIRYKYAGNPLPEREFCQKMMRSGKMYRAEDLDKDLFVQRKMGAGGSNKYNVFLYKGGVNCKHWWQRVIYLKKNNNKIGVNEAKLMILELEPEDRKDAKWQENPKEVAQIASPSNNYWKVN